MDSPRGLFAGSDSRAWSLRAAVEDNRASLMALLAGAAVLAWPTMVRVISESWSTEQGSHGPIVLMTGLWLLTRMWPKAARYSAMPPRRHAAPVLAIAAILLVLSRVVQILEIEGFLMYGLLIAGLYALIGWRALRELWFPLFYLAFIFPLPETLVAYLTLPLKSLISRTAVDLLHLAGYPIGGLGVTIMIGPYELLVAAACSGLNSIVSLSVIALFYLFVRHEGQWRSAIPSVIMIVPIAIAANLIRVIMLILLTYYGGESVGQGFLHQMAGLFMFVVALGLLIIWDKLISQMIRRLVPTRS